MSDIYSFSDEWRNSEYDRRSHNTQHRKARALKLVNQLIELWDVTDPCKTNLTAEEKDKAARNALLLTGILSELMAGWATDYIIGKAMHAHSFFPYHSDAEYTGAENSHQQGTAKQCDFEQAGRSLSWQFGPSVDHNLKVIRQTLLELIDAKSTCLPKDMAYIVSESIRAVDYGSLPPIFTPRKMKGSKKTYPQLIMQLKAVEHIYYRVGLGRKRTEAIYEVADAYGYDYETIEGWISVLKKKLSQTLYERRVQYAKCMAFSFNNPDSTESLASSWAADQEYGAQALGRDGATFWALAVRNG